MSFGKNPHVARAQAAEQKAHDASDDVARARAFREAAHQWERAAERETPGKRRDEYGQHAARTRALADDDASDAASASTDEAPPVDPTSLNLRPDGARRDVAPEFAVARVPRRRV